jgi:hypothetical protein
VTTVFGARPCFRISLTLDSSAPPSPSLNQDLEDLAFVIDGAP